MNQKMKYWMMCAGLMLSGCGAATMNAGAGPSQPAGAAYGGTVVQGGDTRFAIENHSSESICYVFVSPSTDQSWGPDRLGSSETISPGYARYWTITQGVWDFRFENCQHQPLMERRQVRVDQSGISVAFRQRE